MTASTYTIREDGAHVGPSRVMSLPDGAVLILCPAGHVRDSIRPGEWAHSSAEANAGRSVACHGALRGSDAR